MVALPCEANVLSLIPAKEIDLGVHRVHHGTGDLDHPRTMEQLREKRDIPASTRPGVLDLFEEEGEGKSI